MKKMVGLSHTESICRSKILRKRNSSDGALYKWVTIIVAKIENEGHRYFLLLSQCFQQRYSSQREIRWFFL